MRRETGVLNPETTRFCYKEVDRVKKEIMKAMKELGYHWLKWENLSFPIASLAISGGFVLIDGEFSLFDVLSRKHRTNEISPITDKLRTISGIVPESVNFASGLDNLMHFRCSFPLSKMNSGNWLQAFSG